MRLLPLLLCAPLLACGGAEPAPALIAADAASVIVFGRGLGDIAVSALSGRDCSIVRLDRGQTYCTPIDAPRPATFCTASLARPDCWADPALLPAPRAPIGDTPPPTQAQLRYRAAPWPKSLTAN